MTIEARIRSHIEARISSGEWRPGHRIPYEHELVAKFGCARATVGKALAGLARAGLIERRRKAGSFVAHPHVQSAVLDIPDLDAEIAARTGGYRFEPKGAIPPDLKAIAGFAPDARLRAIAGVHHGGDGPFAYEARLISLSAVPEAQAAEFGPESPGSWLLHHVPWSDARHRISAIGASRELARLLAISPRDACLQVERWTNRLGAPITFVRQIFPGCRYDLTATFKPNP